MIKKLLINAIKEKKELSGLKESFVLNELNRIISKNSKLFKIVSEKDPSKVSRSSDFKRLVKLVRSELRRVSGMFYELDYSKAKNLIESLNKNNFDEISFEILKLHKSTHERLRYYEEIYSEIFTHIQTPKRILDIGAGFNAFSYFFLQEYASPEYFSCDINEFDIDLVNYFFKRAGINGSGFFCDILSDFNKLKSFDADLIFLFKVLDSVESKQKGFSQKLLSGLSAKSIVVSFPLVSLSSKSKINKNKRNWFYKLIDSLRFEYYEFSVKNELFFVLNR